MKLEFKITEKSDFSREVIFVIHFALQKERSQLSPDEAGCGITVLKFCLFSLVDPLLLEGITFPYLEPFQNTRGGKDIKGPDVGPREGILQKSCTRRISSSANSRESRGAKMISEGPFSSDQHIILRRS